MKSLNEYVIEYVQQLEKGAIRKAYKGLTEYMMKLRTHLKNKYPEYHVSGNIYRGYMDMTYFSFTPESLKNKKLKVAIVFIHDGIRYEVWLGGSNKQIQKEYWSLFKESGWNKYHIPSTTKGVDSIIEKILVDNPDFSDPDALTRQIEQGVFEFIEDVADFVSKKH
ncbi:MAG: hypothetical protein MI975_09430 [Cytophagales bacterium]|nr:hypothetical protein [Cytophagales bacterium]